MSVTENIKRFIDAIQDSTSHIHPIYRRNFRELIKFIPIVGSVIDSNTMGLIEDKMLKERIRDLESFCKRALTLRDEEKLETEVLNINYILFLLVIINQSRIIDQSHEVAGELKKLATRQENDKHRINKDFVFVTISGPSAVGKDRVLDKILSLTKKNKKKGSKMRPSVDCVMKFTDRPQRVVDSKYYKFLTKEKYDLLEKSGNIIFPYVKRDYRYGFDRTHLFSLASKAKVVFAIFTHFESWLADRDLLKHLGVNHFAVLLTADHETLLDRSEKRLLEESDRKARIASMEEDIRFINENRYVVKKSFDLIIDNGDRHTVYNTCSKILREVGLNG
ncbi:MAG: nucleoside/nucleotide kinase family protein [Planctomycetota bacterium]|jgi:guanylate kinase